MFFLLIFQLQFSICVHHDFLVHSFTNSNLIVCVGRNGKFICLTLIFQIYLFMYKKSRKYHCKQNLICSHKGSWRQSIHKENNKQRRKTHSENVEANSSNGEGETMMTTTTIIMMMVMKIKTVGCEMLRVFSNCFSLLRLHGEHTPANHIARIRIRHRVKAWIIHPQLILIQWIPANHQHEVTAFHHIGNHNVRIVLQPRLQLSKGNGIWSVKTTNVNNARQLLQRSLFQIIPFNVAIVQTAEITNSESLWMLIEQIQNQWKHPI